MKNIAVRENHLYRKAYAGGKRAFGKYTVVYVLRDLKASKLRCANPQKQYINRVGLTVTKKIGNAVTRNRVKRILRAAYAQNEKIYGIKKGYIVIIAAREAASAVKSTDISEELYGQFLKLEMLERISGVSEK